jgi:DHA1 family tetracycline resistance protein-like MFS transporter
MLKINSEYQKLTPLWIAVFVDILGFSIILPFLPLFITEFNVSPIVIGFLLSSNAIFGFFFGPMLGKLSDKYGRKPFMLISQAGTLAGFILLIFANNIILLFIARVVDGIFSGQFPISKAIIGDVVPPKERPKQMTNIGIAFTLAFLVGPAIGGFLSPFGIMGPGVAASILAGFTIIFTAFYLKETLPSKVGIQKWEKIELNLPPTESVAPYSQEFIQKKSSIWRNKRTKTLLIQYSFMVVAAGIFQTTFSLFGGLRLGLNAQTIGILLSLMGVFQLVFRTFFFNRIRNGLGDPKTVMLGLASFIISYFLLAFVSQTWQLVLVLFYISFSGATSRGITIGFTSRSVDHLNQGKIMGITSSIDSLSQILGPIIGGFLLSLTGNLPFALMLSGLSILPFIISFQVLKFGYDNREKEKISGSAPIIVKAQTQK